MVITGITKINRDELTNILKGLGASITGSVSGKTNYLIIGDILEDGRQVTTGKKYCRALEMKTKIINFDQLQDLLRQRSKDPDFDLENICFQNSKPMEKIIKFEENFSKYNDHNLSKQAINDCSIINTNSSKNFGFLKADIEKNIPVIEKMEIDEVTLKVNLDAKKHCLVTNNVISNDGNEKIINKKNIQNTEVDLWTTKYVPKSTKEIIGNQSNISKIVEWLEDWNEIHINGNKKEAEASKNFAKYKNENPNAKCLLISGDPGIGKTSSIRLLARILGYKLFELNASDQRNKNVIINKVGYLTDSHTLESKKEDKINQKNLILMDEIDGMAGNQDRGGISALIQIVKNTKTPIICICNDRQSQKLKSLVNYCYDIKFTKPDKRLVTKRLVEICLMENLKVEENAIENLCESVGNDIRQCLNFLQFWSRKFSELKFFDLKNHHGKFNKDTAVMINPFDGVKKLLTKDSFFKMNFREKLNLFFLDYDLVPLLVQENYLGCFKDRNLQTLEKMCKSSDHVSYSDILDKKIRSNNEWNLLQDKGIHSCVAVGHYSASFLGYPKFPE